MTSDRPTSPFSLTLAATKASMALRSNVFGGSMTGGGAAVDDPRVNSNARIAVIPGGVMNFSGVRRSRLSIRMLSRKRKSGGRSLLRFADRAQDVAALG